jgi:hypothetical protein
LIRHALLGWLGAWLLRLENRFVRRLWFGFEEIVE